MGITKQHVFHMLTIIICLGVQVRLKYTLCPNFFEKEHVVKDFTPKKVDVLYTWVNGSDPDFVRDYRQFVDPAFTYNSNRYNDNFELLFSLRSLDMYMPFVNNIILYTNGQIPHWLNTSIPNLKVIFHKDVFPEPESQLPTFNSRPIEASMFDIEDLSDIFVYMNDDVFLKGPMHITDYVSKNSGPIFYHTGFQYSMHTKVEHRQTLKFTFESVCPAFEPNARKNTPFKHYILTHAHRTFHKKLSKQLLEMTPLAQDLLNHRVRTVKQLDPIHYLYHANQFISKFCGTNVIEERRVGNYYGLKNFDTREHLQKVIDRWPINSYNINDNIIDGKPGAMAGRYAFREEMIRRYPNPSKFEREDWYLPSEFLQ
ncbi:hypothetical protein PCE1_001733 [Barthelona sp. PCE]